MHVLGVTKAASLHLPLKTTARFAGGVFRARITTVGQRRRILDQYATVKQIITLSAELNDSNKKLREHQDSIDESRAKLTGQLLKAKGSQKIA
ncbi:expressed conserved protein [Echinococcus multilocularis]|uniref:Expressed conserved protein n=1 Tax=Echinococcus multilocularis TaxID=6211 RepID=A0A087W0R9_ECHMU|nr:expressed conserved protein [Echinococcus multilocularis]